MPLISLKLPENIDPPIARTFRMVLAQIDGVLGREHNYDGTHGAITARSLHLEANRFLEAPSPSSVGSWQAYPVVFRQTTTNPTSQPPSLVGRYARVGQTVHVSIQFVMTAGYALGSGGFLFTLPVPAARGTSAVCPAWMVDQGTAFLPAVGQVGATSDLSHVSLFAINTSGLVHETNPMTWATGDALYLSGTYETS